MARNSFDQTFDDSFILKDAGLVAADAAATVGGSARVITLGDARVDLRVVVDITAIEVASNDEGYAIIAQFSDASDFGSGVFNGPCLFVGALEVVKSSADTAVGRYELACTNELNGTVYSYMRLYTECQGSIATGINYAARAVKKA